MSWLSSLGGSAGAAGGAAGGAASSGAATSFSSAGTFSSAPYVSNAAPASFYSGGGGAMSFSPASTFSSAPYVSNAAPASFYSGAGSPAMIPAGGTFTSQAIQASGPIAGEVAGIASGIAARKVAFANARLAMQSATANANAVFAQMRGVASRGRAIGGAQGSGGGGNDYLAYLRNIQAATIAAKTELYKGQLVSAAQKYAGKQALLAGIARAGTSLMSMGRS